MRRVHAALSYCSLWKMDTSGAVNLHLLTSVKSGFEDCPDLADAKSEWQEDLKAVTVLQQELSMSPM